jgi:predicted aspartyl protease
MAQPTIAPEFQYLPPPEPFVGEVKVEVELENTIDRELVRRGLLGEEGVRHVRTTALVDTGAMMLVLPEDIVATLGLPELGTVPVTYADERTEERPLAGVVTVRVAGRDARVDCVVGPPGSEPLLGQIVLEITDLLVDCSRRRLVPNPESPFKPHYKVK